MLIPRILVLVFHEQPVRVVHALDFVADRLEDVDDPILLLGQRAEEDRLGIDRLAQANQLLDDEPAELDVEDFECGLVHAATLHGGRGVAKQAFPPLFPVQGSDASGY